jgi:elongation factor G
MSREQSEKCRQTRGSVAGYEVISVRTRLEDGSYHDVDSSRMALETCARDCVRETFKKADSALLEPSMKVEVDRACASRLAN